MLPTQASEALAKSQGDAKLLAKKLADMRLQKEDAARQLEYNQSEQVGLAALAGAHLRRFCDVVISIRLNATSPSM